MTRVTVALALIVCLASCATQPTPAPSGDTLTLRWMRSGEPVANMRVILMRQEKTARGITKVDGTMRGLAGGFDVGFVSDPNDTWGVKFYPATGTEVSVPEPIRIAGRVTSTTPNARMRLRVGSGRRRPAMMRHRADRVRPYPAVDENVVIGGLVLPDVTEDWQEVPLDAGGAFSTEVLSSETSPQLVAFDDAGGMTTLDLTVPQSVARSATLDAGTLAIGAPMALDFELAFPHTDLPVALMTSLRNVTFDPAQSDAIARHLSLLDQFDDAIFEYATGRTAYALEWSRPTRIAGLPPFTSMEVDVFGPRPSMGFARTVPLGANGPTKVSITADDLNLSRVDETLSPLRGRVVLAGTETPVANAVVVYSDYPMKQETTTDAEGRFTIPRTGLGRRPLWFVDARASNVPADYKTTAMVPVTAADVDVVLGIITLRLPLQTPSDPKQNTDFRSALNETCSFGITYDDQYPACQGMVQQDKSIVQGTVFDCVANEPLNTLAFTVEGPGLWQITYSYTPFLLFQTQVVTVTQNPTEAAIAPVSNTVARATMRFCSDTSCFNGVAATPFQISSYLTDPDSFEDTADSNGFYILFCINTNPLYVYVNFTTTSGERYFYDGEAYDLGTGTIPVVLRRVGLVETAWRRWRREPQPVFALSSAHPFRR